MADFCRIFDVTFDKITDVSAKGKSGMLIHAGLSNITLLSIEKRDDAVELIRPNMKPQEEIVIEKA